MRLLVNFPISQSTLPCAVCDSGANNIYSDTGTCVVLKTKRGLTLFGFLKPKRVSNISVQSVAPVSAAARPNINARRDLIRVALKNTMQIHGIPLNWMACEVVSIMRGPDREELHIQLVIKKWSEQLLRFAMALQRQLLIGLDRFEPAVDHSGYVVSWRFSSDCDCPFPLMPSPDAWVKVVELPVEAESMSVLDRRRSNRRSKRPSNVSKPYPSLSDDGVQHRNFEETLILPSF
jgi:hypothetical protein